MSPANTQKHTKKRVVVVGIGRFGSHLARSLYDQGHDVLVIDNDAETIQAIKGTVSYAVVGNAVSSATMEELGVDEFDIGIVAIGGDEKASIMATVLLKTFDIEVIARAHNQLHAQTLELLGCKRVIRVEDEMGTRVAELLDAEWSEQIQLNQDTKFCWLPAPTTVQDKTLKEAGLSHNGNKLGKRKLRVLCIKSHQNEEINWSPAEDKVIRDGDWLGVAGSSEAVNKFIRGD